MSQPDAPAAAPIAGTADLFVERQAGGSLLMRSRQSLPSYPRCLTERLAHWAYARPHETFLAQRAPDGHWHEISYGEAFDRVRRIAHNLLERQLDARRPIAILSENSLEHALLGLAALHVGIPYAPISPAYSLISTDYVKLRQILEQLSPGLVFAARGERYARAVAAALPGDAELVCLEDRAGERGATRFSALEEASPGAAVDAAHAALGPQSIAKILFTSGSTGRPKGVINTQGMLCSNQAQILACLPGLAQTPPVLVDWLPWNHTFGGNHNFGIVLHNGGSLYIDEGKPVPGLMEQSIANLREVAPTAYYNVPRGFEALAHHLQADPALRDHFFSRLQFMMYAGASLSRPVWDALGQLSVQARGRRTPLLTSLGSTETAPFATFADGRSEQPGDIGLPAPGVELKLVPNQDRFEIRFRGPNITPGYWHAPALTEEAFDEEGFYRMGDAVRLIDPADPGQGLRFEGRIAEDFKLATGTWVAVGPLRAELIAAAAPCVQDVVIAGRDRDFLAALFVLDTHGCATVARDVPAGSPPGAYAAHPAVRRHLQAVLDRLGAAAQGSARRIERAVLLDVPLSIDRHELTDKGSINQRAVLDARAALIEQIYAEAPPATVLRLGRRQPEI